MWVPASDSHAIERVALSYVLSEPLPMKFLQSATTYADNLLAEGKFSDKKSVQEAGFELNGGETAANPPEVIGYSYYSSGNPNEEVVKIQKNAAFVAASTYGTWKAFSQHADTMIGPFIESALEITGISHAKLEYVDRFVFKGEQEHANLSDILDLSKLGLPKQALESGMPWHDRRGWFEVVDQGPVLINSDVVLAEVTHRDQPNARLKSVLITTVVESRFPQPIGELSSLNEVVYGLHKMSKDTLRLAITDDAANSVGL